MDRLARLYYEQAALNGRRLAALGKILEACARVTIPVIVLKGAAIAERIYGNIALRPMQDLDLLVRRQDLEATDCLLRHLGYVPDESEQAREWYGGDDHHHLSPYSSADGRVVVEVHRHIVTRTPTISIPIEDLWQRARPLRGVGALALCPEDLLLHLCLHVSLGHEFSFGLRPMCDISETIRYYGDRIDWEQVVQGAGQWGIGKYVYVTLRLARDLVNAAVPEQVLHSLRPEAFDRKVLLWATAQIFADERQPSPVSPNLAQLRGPKRLRAKGALLLTSAVPSPQVMARLYAVSANSNRIYLYYPVRWRDLLHRHGRAAWRLLRRDETTIVLAEQENQKTALREWLAPSRDRGPKPDRLAECGASAGRSQWPHSIEELRRQS